MIPVEGRACAKVLAEGTMACATDCVPPPQRYIEVLIPSILLRNRVIADIICC